MRIVLEIDDNELKSLLRDVLGGGAPGGKNAVKTSAGAAGTGRRFEVHGDIPELEDLLLSPRSYKALHAYGIDTTEILMACRENFLKNVRGIGRESLGEIEKAVKEAGLSLGSRRAVWVVGPDSCWTYRTDGCDQRRFNTHEEAAGFVESSNIRSEY